MHTISVVVLCMLAGAGAAPAQAPRLTAVATFGCVECSGPAMLSTVLALAVTKDGRIMLADAADPRVRIFDTQGRVERAFGRTGAGPGELQLPIGLGLVDSILVVVDMTNLRVSRFSRSGEAIGSTRTNGFAIVAAFPPHAGAPLVGMSRPAAQPTLTLRRLRGDSLVDVRVIGATEFPERVDGHFELLSVAVAPDGSFAVGDGVGAYRIARYRADGTPFATIRREVARVRRTPEEIRVLTEQRDRNLARTRAMVAAENRSASPGFTPPPIPAVRNFFNMFALAFDERGRLWVRVERGAPEQTVFDVFAATGDYLGEVRVPARMREFTMGAGLLAAVTFDELDVARIGVWRVED